MFFINIVIYVRIFEITDDMSASTNISEQASPHFPEPVLDDSILAEHLKTKDENDIVVIEDQRHIKDTPSEKPSSAG